MANGMEANRHSAAAATWPATHWQGTTGRWITGPARQRFREQPAANNPGRLRTEVAGAEVDVLDMAAAVETIADWADSRQGRAVCACNVHVAMTARHDRRLSDAIATADLVFADGAPIAWMMRQQGFPAQHRVAGPDLMWSYFETAAARDQAVFLYGGSEATLAALQANMARSFPALEVAGAYSQPYRELTDEEDDAIVERLNASGARTVWVALGAPRQEAWIASHRDRVHAVMIGVGAAFDFHAGLVDRAPPWMQRRGLEWLHRLLCEPRRLLRRYAVTNSLFVVLATATSLRRAASRIALRSGT